MSVILLSTPALAQYPFPTELSVGLGGVIDTDPTQTSGNFNVGLAFVLERDQWVEPAIEFGARTNKRRRPMSGHRPARPSGPLS